MTEFITHNDAPSICDAFDPHDYPIVGWIDANYKEILGVLGSYQYFGEHGDPCWWLSTMHDYSIQRFVLLPHFLDVDDLDDVKRWSIFGASETAGAALTEEIRARIKKQKNRCVIGALTKLPLPDSKKAA